MIGTLKEAVENMVISECEAGDIKLTRAIFYVESGKGPQGSQCLSSFLAYLHENP